MRYLTFGEMMLRLKAPGYERLFQSYELQATLAGSEANVAVSLANYGQQADFVTVFPKDNILTDISIRELRSFGVGTDRIVTGEGRYGAYYIEQGSNMLPNKTYYDRKYSSMYFAGPGCIDWDKTFQDIDWFHISGITSAISQSAADLNLEAVKAAKERGITVSCDLNYRGNLWKYGKKVDEVMTELTRYTDVAIGTAGEFATCLGIQVPAAGPSDEEFPTERYLELSRRVMAGFPNLKYVVLMLQINYSMDANSLCTTIYDGETFAKSRVLKSMDIIDRVGAGDAIVGGVIYGLNNLDSLQETAEFGVAAGTLKGSIIGDFNRVSVADVMGIVGSEALEQKR